MRSKIANVDKRKLTASDFSKRPRLRVERGEREARLLLEIMLLLNRHRKTKAIIWTRTTIMRLNQKTMKRNVQIYQQSGRGQT